MHFASRSVFFCSFLLAVTKYSRCCCHVLIHNWRASGILVSFFSCTFVRFRYRSLLVCFLALCAYVSSLHLKLSCRHKNCFSSWWFQTKIAREHETKRSFHLKIFIKARMKEKKRDEKGNEYKEMTTSSTNEWSEEKKKANIDVRIEVLCLFFCIAHFFLRSYPSTEWKFLGKPMPHTMWATTEQKKQRAELFCLLWLQLVCMQKRTKIKMKEPQLKMVEIFLSQNSGSEEAT